MIDHVAATKLGDVTVEQLAQFVIGLAVGVVVLSVLMWLGARLIDGLDRYRR